MGKKYHQTGAAALPSALALLLSHCTTQFAQSGLDCGHLVKIALAALQGQLKLLHRSPQLA